MPLPSFGGCSGAALPVHHAIQPPVGPNAGVASPEMPQPGYSVTPFASGNDHLVGERSHLTAAICFSFRQVGGAWPALQARLERSSFARQEPELAISLSAMPSSASHLASTAS